MIDIRITVPNTTTDHHLGVFFFSWLAIKGYVLYFLRDLILKPAKEAEKKKRGKRKEEVIASPRQRHLGFDRGRGAREMVVFFVVIELDVVVFKANKESERGF